MKTLIFSDTHLTHKFEPRKHKFLERTILGADQVIVNGDLWDGYFTRFDKFLNSKWKRLFPLLLSKKCIYLYGNHDRKEFLDSRTSQFAVEVKKQHLLEFPEQRLVIEHGDRWIRSIDVKLPTNSWTFRMLKSFLAVTLKFEEYGVRTFGRNFYKVYKDAHRRDENTLLKEVVEREFQPNEFLVCGHTHLPEFSLDSHFINTGFIKYRLATYLLIDNGKLNFVNTRY